MDNMNINNTNHFAHAASPPKPPSPSILAMNHLAAEAAAINCANNNNAINARVTNHIFAKSKESFYQTFFDYSPLSMGVVEACPDDMLHIECNYAAARFFGRTPEEVRGHYSSEMGMTHIREAFRTELKCLSLEHVQVHQRTAFASGYTVINEVSAWVDPVLLNTLPPVAVTRYDNPSHMQAKK
jgi:PAS domain-containing protein